MAPLEGAAWHRGPMRTGPCGRAHADGPMPTAPQALARLAGCGLACPECLAVLGDDELGQLLDRGVLAVLVQRYLAVLEQVDPVAHLQHLAVVVRDDDDRDVALLLEI